MLLIQYRKLAKLKQADLHTLYNLDQSQVSDWERGGVVPRDDSLRRLSLAYSEHIAGQSSERIFKHLVEARDLLAITGPLEDAEELIVRDMVNTYPKRVRRAIWHHFKREMEDLPDILAAMKRYFDR